RPPSFTKGFHMTERQNGDYSRDIDIWYARDVYNVGRAFLAFWLLGGLCALGLFGVVFLCWAVTGGASGGHLPPRGSRALLAVAALSAMVGPLGYGLTQRRAGSGAGALRYWALAAVGAGGGLGLLYLVLALGR